VSFISTREPVAFVQRWLRAPVTIPGEVLGVALLGVARATVPQSADVEAWGRFAAEQPVLARLVRATWLDRIVVSPWAVAAFGLSALSLWIVFLEVTRRAVRRWGTPPTERSFATATFSEVVERPADPTAPRGSIEVRGRMGLLGVPLLHAGILLLIVAGLVKALLGADAVAWVLEGETLAAGVGSVQATETGFLARPFSLAEPVRLDAIELLLRSDGSVERESATISIADPPRAKRMAINEAVEVGRGRLYLTQRHGFGVLVEGGAEGSEEKRAIMLSADGELFAGQDVLRDGTAVRVQRSARARPPSSFGELDVRVVRGPALLFAGRVLEGGEIQWPGGRLKVQGTVPWVEIRMADDPSTPFAWAGVALVLLGVMLFALVTPVDVMIAPEARTGPGVARVRVAMRPHRFAALHEDAFKGLVRRVRAGGDR
jgi:hypothetical protein